MEQSRLVGRRSSYRRYLTMRRTWTSVLLRELEARCNDALLLFDEAFVHFLDDAVLHFNRAVALEELGRFDDAVNGYQGAGIDE